MKLPILVLSVLIAQSNYSQNYRMVALGTSTTAGLATSTPDSSWVRRFNYHYKYQLGVVDSTYNLGVSGKNLYNAMPTSYTPPAGRPLPDPLYNVTRANTLLSTLTTPSNGVVIINFPTGGYDTYTISEIMGALQLMYDSAVRLGNRAFVTTTQPRTDAGFNNSAVKKKLADIKDSIINRFGVANTINFWDGMYNPADTTIATGYSAGDNVHFNNAGHRILFERVKAKNVFNLPAPDYRSNVSPTGLWSDASSWQIYNGTTWVTATDPPSSGSGTITILNGDSIRINSFTEIDQMIIEPAGIVSLFNTATTAKAVATLNNGAGDDLIINGKFYISANGVLNGDGNIQNNSTGLFTVRNRGVLETNTVNAGTMWANNTAIIRNRTITNNKTFVLQDFTVHLMLATFINNDSVSITGTGSTYFADSTFSGGTFINSSSGVICKQSALGAANFNATINFTNNGRIKGLGEYAFYNATANTGNIEPGTSPGLLTVNPAFITSRSPLIDIEISTTGAVQGVNYDHLILSAVTPTTKNISSARLRVTDRASDPIGTIYTIVTPASGTIAGSFASVSLSPSLSGPNYNSGNSITVVKSAALPITWGKFVAAAHDNTTRLQWSTLQERNTSHFIIEHSFDGETYDSVGRVEAAGNASDQSIYNFIHGNPGMDSKNYYRIKQTDIDGRETTSAVRIVSFKKESQFITGVRSTVTGSMNIKVNAEKIQLILIDLNGKAINEWSLTAGSHILHFGGIAAGNYLLNVYHNNQRAEIHRILKR